MGVDQPGFWNERYAKGEDGWDLGRPAPPLVSLLRRDPGLALGSAIGPRAHGSHHAVIRAAGRGAAGGICVPRDANRGPNRGTEGKGRVAVPGCGRGHDVELFARRGYEAVGFDFSERAVEAALKAGRDVRLHDVFTLHRDFPSAFDVVWEYTCFCAIDPKRRDEYLEVLAKILKKGGELIALFYPLKEGTEGPPFPVRREEIEERLAKRFRITYAKAPRSSVEHRKGLEILVRARRK